MWMARRARLDHCIASNDLGRGTFEHHFVIWTNRTSEYRQRAPFAAEDGVTLPRGAYASS